MNDLNPESALTYIKQFEQDNTQALSQMQQAEISSRKASYLLYIGKSEESLALINRLYLLLPSFDSQLGVDVLLTHASLLEGKAEVAAAMLKIEQAITIAKTLNESNYLAYAYTALANIHLSNHDDIEALTFYQKAFYLIQEVGDEIEMAYLKYQMARAHAYLKDRDRAVELYKEAIKTFSDHKMTFDEMRVQDLLGLVYLEQKKYQQAIIAFERVLAISKTFNSKAQTYLAYFNLSITYKELKQLDKAFSHFELARPLLIEVDDVFTKGTHHLTEAQLYIHFDKPILAKEALANSLKYYKTFKVDDILSSMVAYYDTNADLFVLTNNYEQAYQNQSKARKLAARYNNENREEARSKYKVMFDTEQAELKAKFLKQQEHLNQVELDNIKTKNQLQFLLIISALIAIVLLGYFFYRQVLTSKTLNRLANSDPLTRLANRRYIFNYANIAFKQSIIEQTSLAIIVFDIDYFKKVNDSFGHTAGDDVLVELAKLASEIVRSQDSIARIGGEEFLIVLPQTERQQAIEVAERIREEIERKTINFDDRKIQVTSSFGVAQRTTTDTEFLTLFNRADIALYRAKDHGRNQVMADDV
ncbi:tetratricopeptide repeat-containing diguanylate cyclase [Psychrobium sp. 1_MG-2023]|uniref:tetratricopeptide repeat-containing diguanylate cyclase n=1 Tax=Psychrobium sp. 1_MG-2023 TaxID=3062624 RepID=UPI002736F96B|nr:tetratricopeptide repeat-containing diguanylate cyclase [Psychrobium sp. 1_MG-2023]MDP2561897.1 diguanylate cyclase [Psychrobium sp. 1_MG-2023]